MRVVCISDTHNLHDELTLPAGDVLVHAGDATCSGSLPETEVFLAWLSAQPHATKIFVPGNHDPAFTIAGIRASLAKKYPAVHVLIDEELWLPGMRIYGSPWLPGLITEEEHFWIAARSPLLEENWDDVPDDTALLITHGPPYGVLDKNEAGQNIGDPVLIHRLSGLASLRAHVFGHVHSSYGSLKRDGRLYVNAAICASNYKATHRPIVFDLTPEGAILPDVVC